MKAFLTGVALLVVVAVGTWALLGYGLTVPSQDVYKTENVRL